MRLTGRSEKGKDGWVLYMLAFESEPREQFRTNWEDPGGKVDHQLGKEESFTLNGLTSALQVEAKKGPN